MSAEHNPIVPRAHLDHAVQGQLRSQLVEQRASLLERLVSEPGSESVHSAVEAAAFAHAAESLEEVEAALRRVEAGTYGWCEACQEAIPVERLEVVPAAARCVRCQTQAMSMLR
jgi:RNA polymerase-binding transcription factor DksA